MAGEWRLLLSLPLLVLCGSQPSSSNMCSTGDTRLAGGSSYLEGRVEVCFRGNWGTVCDDQWELTNHGQNNANVACKQLGFSDQGAEILLGLAGTGSIFLDDLQCNGNENNLFGCPRLSDCEHDEDVGVVCQSDDVVLVHEGQLIPNNSIFPLENLGNSTSGSQLHCVTTQPFCCLTNRSGNWFLPSGITLDSSPGPSGLYQSHQDDQSISLNSRPSSVSFEEGLYHCEVPDRNGVTQVLYVGIYSANQGMVRISDMRYDSSSQTFICTSTGGPATTVSWSKNSTPLVVDGTTFQQSQILMDANMAMYENRLSVITKSEDLSGVYMCTVQNSRNTDSSRVNATVCVDGSLRLNNADITAGPRIEICSNDTWMLLEPNFQIRTGQSILRNLAGIPMAPSSIVLSWDVQNTLGTSSVVRYDVTCSTGSTSSSTSVNRGSEAAVLTNLLSSNTYQCCVTAYLDRLLFNLVAFTSTECVSVNTLSSLPVSSQSSIPGLSTVTYALGGLVGLLLLAIVIVTVGCIYVVLSKRKYQITHPRSQNQCIRTDSNFLVNNPIYKSTTSIAGAENGLRSNTSSSMLRAVGSDPVLPINHHKLTAAENPQYGTHQQPPPNQKPPRYTKVCTEVEPTYELIQGSTTAASSESVKGESEKEPGRASGDPIYSTPVPVKKGNGLPLYESTMDIAAPAGKDGQYSQLKHDQK